jgi:uridine phosphorylase
VAQGKIGATSVAIRKLGVGAPAAVTVLEEAIALGVRDIIIVGTGGSLQPALPIGSVIVPTSAIREEGTSFHYMPAGVDLSPDPSLTQALAEAVVGQGSIVTFGPVWTTDAPYREMRSKVLAYGAMGALAVEMEASALFALAQFRGVRLGMVMTISDELFHEWRPGFHTAELRAGQKVITQAALQVAARLGPPAEG